MDVATLQQAKADAKKNYASRQNVLTARHIVTDDNTGTYLQAQTPLVFGDINPAVRQVVVDVKDQKQAVIGVGAAMTDSSAAQFMLKMNRTDRLALADTLYSPGKGAFGALRIPAPDSDYTAIQNVSADRTIVGKTQGASLVSATSFKLDTPLTIGASAIIDGDLQAAPAVASAANASTISLTKLFNAGEAIAIAIGNQQEFRTVVGTPTGTGPYITTLGPYTDPVTAITSATNLVYPHATTDPVVGISNLRQELFTVADSAPFTTGTLNGAFGSGVTSISSTIRVPAGSVITIDTGGNAESLTTGTPTGTGPYTIPLTTATTKAHASGVAVTPIAPFVIVPAAPLGIAHASGALVALRDPTLANFAFDHALSYLVPAIKIIQAAGHPKTLLSNWTVIEWMKTTLAGGFGRIRSAEIPTFALYLAKVTAAYIANGVTIDYVSPQNEPNDQVGSLTYFTTADYITLCVNLRTQLNALNLYEVQILGYEGQWSGTAWIQTVLANATAVKAIDIIGEHSYAGSVDAMLDQRRSSSKPQFVTEKRTKQSENFYTCELDIFADLMIGSFRSWAEAVFLWNLFLDELGGPNSNVNLSSDPRRPIVVIPSDGSGNLTYHADYRSLLHFTSVVKPGARRIASTSFGRTGALGTDVQSVAFLNLDGSVATLLMNASPTTSATIQVVDARVNKAIQLPPMVAGQMSSLIWGETSNSVLLQPAASSVTPIVPATIPPALNGSVATWRDTTNNANQVVSTTVVPAGTNQILVVIVAGADGPNLQSAPYSILCGSTVMQTATLAYGNNGSSQRWVTIAYLVNPPVGTQTITVNSIQKTVFNVVAQTIQLNDQIDPVGVMQNNGGASSGVVSTTTKGGSTADLVLSVIACRTTSAITPGAGQTLLAAVQQGSNWMAVTTKPGTVADNVNSFTFVPLTSPDTYVITSVALHGVNH